VNFEAQEEPKTIGMKLYYNTAAHVHRKACAEKFIGLIILFQNPSLYKLR
jgi:hypothetical protein